MTEHPVTPDGRYFVVRGRLWRRSDPALDPAERQALVSQLMRARRGVRDALASGDEERLKAARQAVEAAKTGLGERGRPWWTDGAADMNRRMALDTPYAEWWRGERAAAPLQRTEDQGGAPSRRVHLREP